MKAGLISVVVCALVTAAAAASSLCEGTWKIDRLEKCENHEQYPIAIEFSKRKCDRTTDCFSLDIEFPEDFGIEYGLLMESFEKCDGGYKASDVISGGACDMFNEFVKENFQDVLGKIGVEPKDCPIPKGKYDLKDYVIDYEKLPEQGKCGEHKWDIYLLKNGEVQSCIIAYSSFTAKEDNDKEEER